jgi:hypothetical protein
VIATRDGGVLELFFFFLLSRYVVPGSCQSKYPSNDSVDPLYQPDDRTGEKLMVEVRAENQNKIKQKTKGSSIPGVYI